MPEERIVDRQTREDGTLMRQIVAKAGDNAPFTLQQTRNAFNFEYTMNPGAGCFYNCIYCFLRQPFFARHLSKGVSHSQEMSYKEGFADKVIRWLDQHQDLPLYERRCQVGVTTDFFHPRMLKHYQPAKVLEAFRDHGSNWMIHLLTKSSAILEFADLLAEMRSQVQVEVSLVTLDEDHYERFESGTPNPRSRLKIIEELSRRGVFVRTMCMPVLREYKIETVKDKQLTVYRHRASGVEAPMKAAGREGKEGGVEYRQFQDGHWLAVEDIAAWEPVVVHDYSRPHEMKKICEDLGAKAFKSKDLNYFYVPELLRASEQGRAPTRQKGRFEDPNVEILHHSGEWVPDSQGQPLEVEVADYTVPRKRWIGGQRPTVKRRVMNWGYSQMTDRRYVTCV